MPYNLRRARRPINRIRQICPEVRPSDLDGASDEELEEILSVLKPVKKAIGPGGSLGPSWVEVDNYNPYSPDPMVTPKGWYGGGPFDKPRRDNFPGGQDPLSSGPDEAKNYPVRSNFPDAAFKGKGDKTRPKDEFQWKISLPLRQWDDPEKIVKRMSEVGDHVESDDRNVFLVVDDYEDAVIVQRMFPGTIVERRRRQM